MEKKYKLTDDTIIVDGRTLYRIEALKDFNNVKKGDKGGFVEKEENLSQYSDCWIYDDAKVYDNAKVSSRAIVCGKAQVYDNAKVCDNAEIGGNTEVC